MTKADQLAYNTLTTQKEQLAREIKDIKGKREYEITL